VAPVVLGALCMPARADVVEIAVRPSRQPISRDDDGPDPLIGGTAVTATVPVRALAVA